MDSEAVSVDLSLLSLPQFREPMIGAEIARVMSIALFALTIYEYAITVDDEKKHFWKGPFSVSHGLFFFNRYFPACIMIMNIICFSAINPSVDFCKSAIQMSFLLNLLGISVIQAILITRVWFLFPGVPFIRIILILGFLASVATSFGFLYISASQLQILSIAPDPRILIPGCRASRPPGFWRIYLPSLILHTGIYILTIHQALTNADCWKRVPLRKRLLRDGGVFYLIVLCSVGFTSVGSFLTKAPRVNIPAIFSPLVLATTSIATTRIMFSLRSVAVSVGSDFEWLPMPEAEHDTESIAPSKLKMVISAPISSTFRKTKRDEENGLW